MAFVKSLKSDPLGIVDTRLKMTDPPTDGFFSPFAPSPFTGFDRTDEKQPGGQTKAEASPKQAHRGFDSSRQCPRLELDVDVDKYHTLDGLAEPLNPQNTPASNSERESMEETTGSLRCYKIENLRTNSAPQMSEFNFDCFQDSPEASLVCQDDGRESPKPSKLRCLSVGRRQWIKYPVASLANRYPDINASNFEKSAKSGSLLRSVRFSPPAASLSPFSRATRRPLPSIERRQDYIVLHRQKKQYRKWKLTRHANSQKCSPCNIPPKTTQSLAARIPKNYDMRVSSLSSLPYRETRQTPVFTRVGSGGHVLEVRSGKVAENVDDTPVADDSKIAGNTKQNVPAFLAVSFSLYRIRHSPSSSTEKPPRYSFKFRMIQTDLPQQPSPHFPTEFEHIACHPVIDDLLFHACFIVPALVVLLPLRVILAATHPLVNTRAGAVILYLARALLYLLTNILIFVLFKLGVSCGCQWTPDTGYSN
ncbi:hypothetical protein N7447_006977 [Penicillium robsamsonii]|uniref:uncharacterized protein n=1 Tax=Penicillium robsamsonii TaxID=1792511 RepID=UPI002549637D|nr:uncharacterized protein N7447_006977 [Penicillium robsamsonii]KAJ5824637.1 hypothetical protein N7447_006977 [Penicillium robsamsonii]